MTRTPQSVTSKKSPRKSSQPRLPSEPYSLGKCYLIRTVTFFATGRLVGIFPQELVLEDAAWVADTGRFNDALATGSLNEVEPIHGGHLVIGRGAIVDAMFWTHPLPTAVK